MVMKRLHIILLAGLYLCMSVWTGSYIYGFLSDLDTPERIVGSVILGSLWPTTLVSLSE
jgi:hypothetical protein